MALSVVAGRYDVTALSANVILDSLATVSADVMTIARNPGRFKFSSVIERVSPDSNDAV